MGAYKNAMELLVEEEVARQFKALPPKIASYINQLELVAYALNQLPPLYATSEKGLEHQLERGKVKYSAQITQAVQRALAAIRRDPLRTYVPLQSHQAAPLREVLYQLRLLLKNDKVDWKTLPTVVEQALTQASQGSLPWGMPSAKRSPSYAPIRRSSPFPSQQIPEPLPAPEKPPTPERSRSVRAPRRDDCRSEAFGWDDPLYHSH
jgi:hypothetical protein